MSLEERFENLIEEQKARLRACKTKEEFVAFFMGRLLAVQERVLSMLDSA